MAVIVAVDCAEPDALTVTCVGEITQGALAGAPPHESDTVPLNPPTDVTVSVYVPLLLRATASELGDTFSVKSAIDCVNVAEVLPAKFAFVEANVATTVWVPALSELVENCAKPVESATVADGVLLPST